MQSLKTELSKYIYIAKGLGGKVQSVVGFGPDVLKEIIDCLDG